MLPLLSGKIAQGTAVEPGMASAAAVAAVERALQKGDLGTLPNVDAERIAAAARRYSVKPEELGVAAADIRDWSRVPTGELARVVWRVLGDPGADVLDLASGLLRSENDGSTAVATTNDDEDDERN